MLRQGGNTLAPLLLIAQREPDAYPCGRDATGVVHGLEFVVADGGFPGEGFGGGAGTEVAAVGEPMDLVGAGGGIGLEHQAVLLMSVRLDVVGECRLRAEDFRRRSDWGGGVDGHVLGKLCGGGAGEAGFSKLIEALGGPDFDDAFADLLVHLA